jgi:hypothetical protein
VLGHDDVWVLLGVAQDIQDLLIRKVLENLSDQAQIAVRQLVLYDVQALKLHALAAV